MPLQFAPRRCCHRPARADAAAARPRGCCRRVPARMLPPRARADAAAARPRRCCNSSGLCRSCRPPGRADAAARAR